MTWVKQKSGKEAAFAVQDLVRRLLCTADPLLDHSRCCLTFYLEMTTTDETRQRCCETFVWVFETVHVVCRLHHKTRLKQSDLPNSVPGLPCQPHVWHVFCRFDYLFCLSFFLTNLFWSKLMDFQKWAMWCCLGFCMKLLQSTCKAIRLYQIAVGSPDGQFECFFLSLFFLKTLVTSSVHDCFITASCDLSYDQKSL